MIDFKINEEDALAGRRALVAEFGFDNTLPLLEISLGSQAAFLSLFARDYRPTLKQMIAGFSELGVYNRLVVASIMRALEGAELRPEDIEFVIQTATDIRLEKEGSKAGEDPVLDDAIVKGLEHEREPMAKVLVAWGDLSRSHRFIATEFFKNLATQSYERFQKFLTDTAHSYYLGQRGVV